MIRRFALPTTLLLALLAAPAWGAKELEEFEELSIRFELNETDQDAEVLMFAKAGEGLDRLIVIDPRGDRRVDFKAGGRRDIGQAEVLVESAEPSVGRVKRSFPEGRYTFVGRTVSGQQLVGTATLSHALLPAPSFSPGEDDVVDPDEVVVSWSPVAGAAGYQVEIEQDEGGVNLTFAVGPDVSSLAIPAGVLAAGTEYEIGVATLTPAGNVAVAESSFTTEE